MKGCPARWSIPAVTILAIIGPVAVRLAADDAAAKSPPSRFAQAIKRGVDYLKHSQSQDGTWPDYVNNHRRRDGAVHAGLAHGRRTARQRSDGAGDLVRPRFAAGKDLRRGPADHGVVHGGAAERSADHSPQRAVAGGIAKSGRAEKGVVVVQSRAARRRQFEHAVRHAGAARGGARRHSRFGTHLEAGRCSTG